MNNIHEKIVKKGDKWLVKTKRGDKTLGTHDSRDKAVNQLQAIEINKGLNESTSLKQMVSDQLGTELPALVNKLLVHYGFNPDELQELGCGNFGCAYEVGNKWVMKLTTDKSEVGSAQKLISSGQKFKHIVHYFSANKIKGTDVWVLFLEKLNPLGQFGPVVDEFNYALQVVSRELGVLKAGAQPFKSYYMLPAGLKKKFKAKVYEKLDGVISTGNIDFMFYELDELIKEMKHLGLMAFDLHSGNIRFNDDNRLVYFDLGGSTLKPTVDRELALTENYHMLRDALETDPDELAKKVGEHLGINGLNKLGCGAFGCAYSSGDLVLKLTTEADEAANAKKLLGQTVEHLAKYSVVKRIKDRGVWVLVMPKYEVLSESEKDELSSLVRYVRMAFEQSMKASGVRTFVEYIRANNYTSLDDFMTLLHGARKQFDTSKVELLEQLLLVYLEMAKYDIDAMDIHGNNFGYTRGGNLVFFDMGSSVRPQATVDDVLMEKKWSERWSQDITRGPANPLYDGGESSVNESENDVEYKRGTDGEDGYYIRAIVDGKVVGEIAFYEVWHDYSYFEDYMDEERYDELFPDDHWMDMQYLQVKPQYRGMGIGRKLFADAVAWAETFGVPLYGNASPMGSDGPRARELFNLYSQYGFTELVDEGDNIQMYKPAVKAVVNEIRDDSELDDIQLRIKNIGLKDIKISIGVNGWRHGSFYIGFKDRELDALLVDKMQEEFNEDRPVIDIEYDNLNRIHIDAIPSTFTNLGLGRKIYEKMANYIGYIASYEGRPSRSGDADRLWSSFEHSSRLYYLRIGDRLDILISRNKVIERVKRLGIKLKNKYDDLKSIKITGTLPTELYKYLYYSDRDWLFMSDEEREELGDYQLSEQRKKVQLSESQMRYIWENAGKSDDVRSVVRDILVDCDGFYSNRYDLIKAVSGWPSDVDGENFEYVLINKDRIIVMAGGDWQEPSFIAISLDGGRLVGERTDVASMVLNSSGGVLSKTKACELLGLEK